MKSYRVRYHEKVADDLNGIAFRLLEYAGPNSAFRIVEELRNVARGLRHVPHRGSLRSELMPGLRAIPASNEGVIAFTVIDDRREVFIHHISYGGADWQDRVIERPYG